MSEENLMDTNRLEAFYDAIIAIIVTVLVLELPQPASASLAAIWAIKTSYFAYLISFLVCVNLWQYHHLIYQHVERIDAKVIWLNIILMFVFSWFLNFLFVFQFFVYFCFVFCCKNKQKNCNVGKIYY